MQYDEANVFADSTSLRETLLHADIKLQTCDDIVGASSTAVAKLNHGDLPRWVEALNQLPSVTPVDSDCESLQVKNNLTEPAITVSINTSNNSILSRIEQQTNDALSGLKPWRKGPFNIAGTYIDTEWRSDQKWQRVHPHISDLTDRRVLDVGCGNGYYAWRMRGAGAQLVLGIDPSTLFMLQFKAVQHFINDPRVQLLPLTLEALPPDTCAFDTVFSMGVLYHRRNPMDHLRRLWCCLQSGGELILETLLIPGDNEAVLQPAQPADDTNPSAHGGRYARMRNVWSLPTEQVLHDWLQRTGFDAIRTVDISQTTIDEQRTTEWMPYESLQQALDPHNTGLTIEGFPAPTRITLVARKPEK